MGLSSQSTGICAAKCGLDIKKCHDSDLIVALAGNPNVGKSTVFNQLTGLHQHTGNWTGKTVSNAMGECCCHDCHYILVDIPGTYSLSAHSAEEEVARDFICFGGADSIIVVCDATNLERTDVFDTYVYRFGLKNGRLSYATAVGVFKSAISLVVLFLTNRANKKLTGNSVF